MVVTGVGVVTSLGQSISVFWQNILAGKCGIGPVTAFDVSAYTTRIAAEVRDFDPSSARTATRNLPSSPRTRPYWIAGWI